MRSIVALALVACAGHVPPLERPVRYVRCGGVRIDVPPSLRMVRVTSNQLIAASNDVALAVFEDGDGAASDKARVIEQISDADRPMYRIAFRDAQRCTFRAVALYPLSAVGLATLGAVAGTPEPGLIVGSPRVPHETAFSVLLRNSQDHL